MKFQDMPYERVDFQQVEKEMRELTAALGRASSGEEQFQIHQKYYDLTDRVDTMITIAMIRFDGNTEDSFYNGEQEFYDEQLPAYSNLILEYQKQLYDSPYRAYLEKKIGPVAFKNMELT